MSNFSQIMNDRSEARRIYNQRRKISQLELKNEKLEQEIKELKEMWKDTNVIIKDNKKLMMNRNAYDYLEEKDKEIERLRKENQQLKEDIKFCINTMKNEYECTDKRTNRELHTMVEILEKWTKEYKEGSV